jgi:hypothetical protein
MLVHCNLAWGHAAKASLSYSFCSIIFVVVVVKIKCIGSWCVIDIVPAGHVETCTKLLKFSKLFPGHTLAWVIPGMIGQRHAWMHWVQVQLPTELSVSTCQWYDWSTLINDTTVDVQPGSHPAAGAVSSRAKYSFSPTTCTIGTF